ncbi:MAG: 30S ribosomal protein S7 [Parcubacteria group bacterium GW2011_GWB1_48_6]|nr:MAG: 30S ribosomal protein S7 [Parcubacteria group bacterium GW2011_GWB1_48_6]
MRRPVKTRKVVDVDSKYGSVLVNRLINQIMRDGKKSTARQIVYSAMLLAEEQLKKPALEVVETAMENAGPQLELRSRRIGGANYQVPYEVRAERKVTLALRWIVGAARSAKGKAMHKKLAEEIINAVNGTGNAVKKKNDMHRMAEANKAFAHFAW